MTSGQILAIDCSVCGTSFDYQIKSVGRYARFCSDRCRNRARRSSKGAVALNCAKCGTLFVPPRRSPKEKVSGRGRYCSRACAPQHEKRVTLQQSRDQERRNAQISRARCKGATVLERIDDQAIFDRDGWTCGICGEPVDPLLKRPQRMAVCIDHIVPLARGGQHTAVNIRCAHWLCNSLKGAQDKARPRSSEIDAALRVSQPHIGKGIDDSESRKGDGIASLTRALPIMRKGL